MGRAKFSMNALLLVVLIFSAIIFFFTVTLVNLSDRRIVNEYYPIEGTNLAVRYSTRLPYGIYQGAENGGTLKVEGSFGHDWGCVLEGESLYLNEYITTDLGLMLCQVVRVDLNTFQKEVLLSNAILRGRCASGELVCLGGYLMPSNAPATNSLCRLYSLSAPDISLTGDGALVTVLDPGSGRVLYSAWDGQALTGAFETRYLDRTLEEIRT